MDKEIDEIKTKFQFTHPVWGATDVDNLLAKVQPVFQFTHPVWGAT